MARKRWLSTNVSNDRRVAELAKRAGLGAALLYTWCIPHATDDAQLTSDPEELLSQIAPLLAMRGLVTIEDVHALREHAVDLGLLEQSDDHLRFPRGSFYGYQSYIGYPRRGSEQNGEEHSDSHRINADHSKTAPSSYSSSSSSFYLDRYADATLSTRARAREDFDPSRSCSACHKRLPARRPKYGLCADCLGKAHIAAKRTGVDVQQADEVTLINLASSGSA